MLMLSVVIMMNDVVYCCFFVLFCFVIIGGVECFLNEGDLIMCILIMMCLFVLFGSILVVGLIFFSLVVVDEGCDWDFG